MSFLASDGQDREDGRNTTTSKRFASIIERVSFILFIIFVLQILGYLAVVAFDFNFMHPERSAFHVDFVAFWAAAKLAAAGQAVSAFDQQTLFAAQSLLPEDDIFNDLFWLYPPGFHLLLIPLGYLGFSLAFTIFTVCSGTLYYFGLRGWTRGRPAVITHPPLR